MFLIGRMKHIFLLVILYCLIQLGSTTTVGCPESYTSIDSTTCYKVSNTWRNRDIAAAWCAYDGATLASINNGFMNTYIYQLAAQQNAFTVWLGTKCPGGDISKCVNDDGSPVGQYTNFYKGNPSSVGDCVVMSLENPSNQQWISYNCSVDTYGYACEISYGTTNKCPHLYALFQGMCYSFNYVLAASRDDAVAKCQAVPGGSLASVPNADVNRFLLDIELMHTGNNPGSYFGLSCPSVKFTGDTSSCAWDDGTPFNYTAFASGFPLPNKNILCPDFNDGDWTNDQDCGHWWYFCQAPPSS